MLCTVLCPSIHVEFLNFYVLFERSLLLCLWEDNLCYVSFFYISQSKEASRDVWQFNCFLLEGWDLLCSLSLSLSLSQPKQTPLLEGGYLSGIVFEYWNMKSVSIFIEFYVIVFGETSILFCGFGKYGF